MRDRDCKCKFPRKPTTENLMRLGSGCTADLAHPYVCPKLDQLRREVTKREDNERRRARKAAEKARREAAVVT